MLRADGGCKRIASCGSFTFADGCMCACTEDVDCSPQQLSAKEKEKDAGSRSRVKQVRRKRPRLILPNKLRWNGLDCSYQEVAMAPVESSRLLVSEGLDWSEPGWATGQPTSPAIEAPGAKAQLCHTSHST